MELHIQYYSDIYTYEAAILFCKRLEAELNGVDLEAWAKQELSDKRRCTTCEIHKPLDRFYNGSASKTGYRRRFECIDCVIAKKLAIYHNRKAA